MEASHTPSTRGVSPLVFRLAQSGDELITSRQGRGLSRLLADALDAHCPTEVVLDATGLKRARPLPLHQLLKEIRKRLQVHYPEGQVRFVGAGASVRKALDAVLAERRDFAAVAGEAGYELTLTCPASIEVDGEVLLIGSRRRAMLTVIERDGPGCVWCSKELSYDHPEATLDHVRPYASNGSNKITNLLLSCAECNHGRRRAPAALWLRRCLERGQAVNEVAVLAALKRVKKNQNTRRSVLAARHARAEARASARNS